MKKSIKGIRKPVQKLALLLITIVVMSSPAKAQIFGLNENNYREDADFEELEDLNIPIHFENYDQAYAPIGSGIGLLATLGGAYLLGKKRKK